MGCIKFHVFPSKQRGPGERGQNIPHFSAFQQVYFHFIVFEFSKTAFGNVCVCVSKRETSDTVVA